MRRHTFAVVIVFGAASAFAADTPKARSSFDVITQVLGQILPEKYTDCGRTVVKFGEALTTSGHPALADPAESCAEEALKKGDTFLFARETQGPDSMFTEIFIQREKRKQFLLVLDSDVCGAGNQKTPGCGPRVELRPCRFTILENQGMGRIGCAKKE